MNEYGFTAEVARSIRDKNAELWRSGLLRERAYTSREGIIRVGADWEPLVSEEEIARIDVWVIDDDGRLAVRDVSSFVEIFFHDVFLLVNIADPGSFGGAVTVSGGEFRVNDMVFDASAFAYAASPPALPLSEVVAWYCGGTEQVATTPMQRVFFHLLHIARGECDEWMLRARLADCLTALGISDLVVAEVPLLHPMHDETLDERVDDSATEEIDRAMARVVVAIQDAVRGYQ
jgi:hypothetical protein